MLNNQYQFITFPSFVVVLSSKRVCAFQRGIGTPSAWAHCGVVAVLHAMKDIFEDDAKSVAERLTNQEAEGSHSAMECRRLRCGYCRGFEGETPNPITSQRSKHAYLIFTKKDRKQCDVCRNYLDWAHRQEDHRKLKDKLEEQQCEYDTYMDGRQNYVDQRNANNGRAPQRLAVAEKVNEDMNIQRECLGIFWPKDTWEKYFKRVLSYK